MTQKALPTARRAAPSTTVPRAAAVQQQALRSGMGMLAIALVAVGVTGASLPSAPSVEVAVAPQLENAVAAVRAAAAAEEAPVSTAQAAATAAIASPSALFAVLAHAEPNAKYYEKLRAEMRWTPVRVGKAKLATPDARSRLLLAQSAAELAELEEVGLDFRDVYGVINAETTWVPRAGLGKNGVTSHGLAQFEPGTAKAVGLSNPNDPVEAVHAAAVLLKEAAEWSNRRIAALNLTPEMHAVKLREGVSIYYNLSSKARRQWSGANTAQLPVETQRHIHNVRLGAAQAEASYERIAGAPTGHAMTHVTYVPAPVFEAPAAVQHAAVTRTGKPLQQAKVRAPVAAAKPAGKIVVVADNGGRKTWVMPQGSISWSKG